MRSPSRCRLGAQREQQPVHQHRGNDQRRDQSDLEQVRIVGKKGEVVPLNSVARVEERLSSEASQPVEYVE
jgi:multidrug efflux pump subunit AcrB